VGGGGGGGGGGVGGGGVGKKKRGVLRLRCSSVSLNAVTAPCPLDGLLVGASTEPRDAASASLAVAASTCCHLPTAFPTRFLEDELQKSLIFWSG